MHPLAYEHLKKIVSEQQQIGSNESCDYYPCHFEGQDCTWCFCPFYPCEDEEVGGRWVERKDGSSIWGCSHCFWIHRADVARAILDDFAALGIKDVAEIDERREELMQLFQRLKERYPPEPRQ
jgi:Zn-finger protein